MSSHSYSPEPEEEPCCHLSKTTKIWLGLLGILVVGAIVAGVVFGVLAWLQASKSKPKEWSGKGTTPHFTEIILGRCYTYTQIQRPELGNYDCQKIVNAFLGALISKDPCSTTDQDYQLLMKLTNQTVPCDTVVFWSKSSELAHQYTRVQQTMFTLEDTLLGYMADGLYWCGDVATSELNYQSCPHWRKDCLPTTVSVFWDTLSKRFAENACGMVHVLLNGSMSNPFDRNRPTCVSSSIQDLGSILGSRGIGFNCQDDYRPIQFLQCVKNPNDCP